jgi:flagellar motor component MotA
MVKYILSLVLGVVLLLFTITIRGSNPLSYVDVPNLMFVVVCPFILMYILNGHNAVKTAFSAPFKNTVSKEALLTANEYFKKYNEVTWLLTVFAVIIDIISMLRWLEDKEAVAANLSFALLSVLYAILINVLVIIPFKILINKKILGKV